MLPVSIVLFLFSCTGSSSQGKNDGEDSTKKQVVVKFDHTYDEVARYIAGMPLRDSIIPQELQNDTWKKYCADMDSNWGKMEDTRLKQMRAWTAENLKNENANPGTVWYPFSGPDMVHVYQFFPNANKYILMAMEFPGSLPKVTKMNSTQAVTYLTNLKGALKEVMERSYFITSFMSKAVSGNAKGTVPIICLFLVRSGNEIIDIKKYHLNDDGTKTPLTNDSSLIGIKNDFAEIDFRKIGSDKIQKVVYVSCNLSNDYYPDTKIPGLRVNKALYNWMNTETKDCYTYLKAASYLPHNGGSGFMGMIDSMMLNHSKTVLQDDTGLPLKYFSADKWKISVFGNYSKPIADFSKLGMGYQPDLQKLYDAGNVGKMDFSLGYHFKDQINQNLLLAQKK